MFTLTPSVGCPWARHDDAWRACLAQDVIAEREDHARLLGELDELARDGRGHDPRMPPAHERLDADDVAGLHA